SSTLRTSPASHSTVCTTPRIFHACSSRVCTRVAGARYIRENQASSKYEGGTVARRDPIGGRLLSSGFAAPREDAEGDGGRPRGDGPVAQPFPAPASRRRVPEGARERGQGDREGDRDAVARAAGPTAAAYAHAAWAERRVLDQLHAQ